MREGAVHPEKATPLPVSLRDLGGQRLSTGCLHFLKPPGDLRARPWAAGSRNTITLFTSGQAAADAGTLGEMHAHCSSAGPELRAAKTGRLRKPGLMKGS